MRQYTQQVRLLDRDETNKCLKTFFACAERTPKNRRLRRNRPKMKPREEKDLHHVFSAAGPAKKTGKKTCKKRAAQEKRGARAAPCLRQVVKKTGFTTKRCASATRHHLFYALVYSSIMGLSCRFHAAFMSRGSVEFRRGSDAPVILFLRSMKKS